MLTVRINDGHFLGGDLQMSDPAAARITYVLHYGARHVFVGTLLVRTADRLTSEQAQQWASPWVGDTTIGWEAPSSRRAARQRLGQFYGPVNDLIRAALYPYAHSLRIVTKVGAVAHPTQRLTAAQKPVDLRGSVEDNLRALGTDHLAVVNLRRLDMPPGIAATGDQVVDLDSQLAELIALRDGGKIGGIGLSQVSLAQLRQALPAGIVCVQNMYNVLVRGQEEVLTECAGQGIAWVPYFPLGSAFGRLPNVSESPVVIAHAERLGITPA